MNKGLGSDAVKDWFLKHCQLVVALSLIAETLADFLHPSMRKGIFWALTLLAGVNLGGWLGRR